jgi:hypothetical protein
MRSGNKILLDPIAVFVEASGIIAVFGDAVKLKTPRANRKSTLMLTSQIEPQGSLF